ncbi:hypothetical protein AURDEDRAFT_183714 [Auricularia subglabra TFB-10046 SS5]|nr:hypothetical protein AURDEDRAFT_183714 [Auricularia subglabra TFB-10046 SS5]
MSIEGGTVTEYERPLHGLASILRAEVDTTTGQLSELNEISSRFAGLRQKVQSIQDDNHDDHSRGRMRRAQSYSSTEGSHPEALQDIHARYCDTLELARTLQGMIPEKLVEYRKARACHDSGLLKAQAIEADFRWLDMPLWLRCYKAFTSDCPVGPWDRAWLIIRGITFVVLTVAALLATVVLVYYGLWPALVALPSVLREIWRWLRTFIYIVRVVVGDSS